MLLIINYKSLKLHKVVHFQLNPWCCCLSLSFLKTYFLRIYCGPGFCRNFTSVTWFSIMAAFLAYNIGNTICMKRFNSSKDHEIIWQCPCWYQHPMGSSNPRAEVTFLFILMVVSPVHAGIQLRMNLSNLSGWAVLMFQIIVLISVGYSKSVSRKQSSLVLVPHLLFSKWKIKGKNTDSLSSCVYLDSTEVT